MMSEDIEDVHCNFCGKHCRDLSLVIAGKESYICDGCVSECRDIIGHRRISNVVKMDKELANNKV